MHKNRTWVITGGSSGLGRAIITAMPDDWFVNLTLAGEGDHPPLPNEHRMVCDITNKEQVAWAADKAEEAFGLINCAGINHIEYTETLSERDWDRVMDTNCKGIFLCAQAMLPHIAPKKGTILNIVSNASHMPMTASLAYNASKGAAHIMTLQMARELTKRYEITVFGISPAKMKSTKMSDYIEHRVPEVRDWTPEQAQQYQLAGLLTGLEIPPSRLARFIAFLLAKKENHVHLSGCVIPYGA